MGVSEKCSEVRYRIKDPHKSGKGRVVHLNTLQTYVERETQIDLSSGCSGK